MKKFLKVLVTVLLVIAAVYFIPRIVMWSRISTLPVTASAEYITDFTLADENTYEISEGNITMQIPTYYASTKVNDYSMIVCDGGLKNRQLVIIYQPFAPVANQIMPGYADKFNEATDKFEESKPGYPWTLLFDVPTDIFEAIRNMYLADKSDYNFWSLTDALELEYYLKLRQDAFDLNLNIHGIYERDDIRAIIAEDPESPGTYVAMIIPENNPKNSYAFVIQTSDTDDIIKLLNTFEFNSMF